MVAPRAAHACFSTYGITRERRLWATPKHTMSSRSSRPSLTSLHDAARKGDSRSLQRLITIIDPTAAKKVAAVFLQRDSGKATCTSSAGTDPSLGKKEKVSQNTGGGPQTNVARRKPGTARKTQPNPLKRLLRKQDTKRRTALYVACAAGNTEVADTLLAVGASSEGHGAWQRTPLHIAAYEAHTSAIRSLLGAGADPWAVNGRGQTPSDVSCMYNANGQVLELIEQAVDMRRVISTGTGGLIGATFVHDDGQAGKVAAVFEQWSFTLEVELDRWELGNGSGAKVFLPVRGRRDHTSTRSSSDNLTASTSHSKTSCTQPQQKRCKQSIPWLAKTVGRMRLESDGLLKVDADSLVGARAYTPVGWGAVMSARDVSVRYEVETVRTNKSEAGVGELTAGTTSTTYSSTGDGANFNVDEGQLTVLGDKTGGSHHARTTDTDGFDSVSPRVVEQRATGSSGSLWEEEINRRTNESGDQNEDGVEPPDRRKRQDEGNEDEQRPPTVFKSCLNERVIHVASRKGPPGESGAYYQVEDDDGRKGSDDALEGCSEGTERAAELDEWAAAIEHGGTREDFTPTQVGAGSWTAHEGADSHSRRHIFLDNLVPLAALEGVVDCQTLPLAATTYQSRARRRRLLAQQNSRVPAPSSPLVSNQTYQQQPATPQQWPASTMLEVDDLFSFGVDQEKLRGSKKQEIGGGGSDAQVEIIGLEEQIEREERSEETMEKKRIAMKATRSAVVEALALWSSKADLLQARLVVVRTMVTTPNVSSMPTTTSAIVNNSQSTSPISLEEYLASPSPRCCACDKRGGYWQAKNVALTVPPSETPPGVAVPAASETVDDTVGGNSNDGGQSTANDRGLRACARNHRCRDEGLVNSDARHGSMDARDEQLVVHLQKCLEHMTHLRDWPRLLDQELG